MLKNKDANPRDPVIEQIETSKANISRLQEEMALSTFHLCREIDLVASILNSKSYDLVGFLSVECKIPRSEALRLLEVAKRLKGKGESLAATRISHSAILALAEADQEVQDESFAKLASGNALDADGIAAAARDHQRNQARVGYLLRKDRLDALAERAISQTRQNLEVFEERLNKLLDAIYEFWSYHLQGQQGRYCDEPVIYSDTPRYQLDHAKIRMLANDVLTSFEAIFGSEHIVRSMWPKTQDAPESEEIALSKAHLSLRRFADGRFGHDGGFKFPADIEHRFDFDIWEALTYLSPDVNPETSPKEQDHGQRLTSLEICVGAGATTLGLQAAGFDPLVLVEENGPAAELLKINWPKQCEVMTGKVQLQAFTRFAGKIDLLAGNLSGKPYLQGSTRMGDRHQDSLLEEVVRIVAEVKPRAVFLRTVQGLLSDHFAMERAKFIGDLEYLKYKVAFYTVDGSKINKGHVHKAVAIIAFPLETVHRFQFPEALPTPTVGQYFEKELMVNRPKHNKKGEILVSARTRQQFGDRPVMTGDYASRSETPDEAAFENWAKDWVEKFSDLSGSEFGDVIRSSDLAAWDEFGFSASKRLEKAPNLKDMAGNDYRTYRPGLTEERLRKLRGIPRSHNLVSKWSSQRKQLIEAYPTTQTRSIGYAIYQALTQVQLDTIALNKTPFPGTDFDPETAAPMPRPPARQPLRNAKGHFMLYDPTSEDQPVFERPYDIRSSRNRRGRPEEEQFAEMKSEIESDCAFSGFPEN